MTRLVLSLCLLLQFSLPAGAQFSPGAGAWAPAAPRYTFTGTTTYGCGSGGTYTSCTATGLITLTTGDVVIVATQFCTDYPGCTGGIAAGQAASVSKAAGTATIGACAAFAGTQNSTTNSVKAEIWWCPVTTGGTFRPTMTYTAAVAFAYLIYVDVGGVSVITPDDGVGNNAIASGTSISIGLAGSGASRAGDLLLSASYANSSNASFSPSSGWTTLLTGLAYNPNGLSGANSATLTYSSNGGGSIAASIAALRPTGPPTILSVSLSNSSFAAGTAGSVGTASASVTNTTWSGSWSLQISGVDHAGTACTNNPVFAINSSTGAISVTSAGLQHSYPGVCVVATQTGAAGSPYIQAFTLTGTGVSWVVSNPSHSDCSEGATNATTCTAQAPQTLTAGHIMVATVDYCLENCTLGTAYATSLASTGGTGALGTCQLLTGTANANAQAVRTEIWWCSVTTSGTVTPQFSFNGLTQYGEINAFDLSGANASPDLGVGNNSYVVSGTSVTLALTGSGAPQAGALLIYAADLGGATSTPPSGWTALETTPNAVAYNPNGAAGTNSLTMTMSGTAADIAIAYGALKH